MIAFVLLFARGALASGDGHLSEVPSAEAVPAAFKGNEPRDVAPRRPAASPLPASRTSPAPAPKLGTADNNRVVVDRAIDGLGPLLDSMPPYAASPALAAAALTGAALLCTSPRFGLEASPWAAPVCQYPLVTSMRGRASFAILVALALMAGLCALANSGKIVGVVGKGLKAIEVVPAVLAFVWTAFITLDQKFNSETVASAGEVHAGFGLTVGAIPLALMLGAVLVCMLAVRFAFDVLIWLSPIPFLDLLLEVAKGAFTIGYIVLVFVSPATAMVFTFLLAVASMILVRWAFRLLAFLFRVLLRPFFASLFSSPPRGIVDWRVIRAYDLSNVMVAVEATALSVGRLTARTSGAVIRTNEGIFFVRSRPKRSAPPIRLDAPWTYLVLQRRALWLELRVVGRDRVERLALATDVVASRPQLCAALGARDGGDVPHGFALFNAPQSRV